MGIAQQLQAVEKAAGNAKRELIHDHIEHCLDDGHDAKASMRELEQLATYLFSWHLLMQRPQDAS